MKNTRTQNTKESKQGMSHKSKPEIRDDLDSRKNKELTQASTSRAKGKKNNKS